MLYYQYVIKLLGTAKAATLNFISGHVLAILSVQWGAVSDSIHN